MTSSGVSIVIPNWNGQELLSRFLPSVLRAAERYAEASQSQTEVIVVDDASCDSSLEWLRETGFCSEQTSLSSGSAAGTRKTALKLISNIRNEGFGESCNRGVREARHPLVFLLNNDVDVHTDAIAPLVENFRNPLLFAAHCKVFNLGDGELCGTGKVGGFSRGFLRVHRSWIPRQETNQLGESFFSMFAGGGAAMYYRDRFLELGGFESLLSPFYWEDVELSYRAWKRGYQVVYEPRAVVRHQVSSTIGRLNRRSVRRIQARNRILSHWIHLHDRLLLGAHICWLAALILTAPLTLRFDFLNGFVAALTRLPKALELRARERTAAVISDREVLGIFRKLGQREDLIVYDRPEDLDAMSG